MRNPIRLGIMVVIATLATGCSAAPPSICEMPQNKHFWQGVDIDWTGEIVDVSSGGHGAVLAFVAKDCAAVVDFTPDMPSVFNPLADQSTHMALATYRVQGRLSFTDGQIMLRPTSVSRLSPWQTYENGGFQRYFRERRAMIPVSVNALE
jgi:hypothetical protein